MKRGRENIIGLIPAAGKARRMRHLPFSKELYPLGMQTLDDAAQIPKVAAMHLIDSMKVAGVRNYYMLIRKGKWDIPAYFQNGRLFGLNMAYLLADKAFGVPYTLSQAFPFTGDKKIAMGFPDIIFQPENAFDILLQALDNQPETDVLLGLFPVNDPSKWDTVEVNNHNRVSAIHIKSNKAEKNAMAWIIAVWNPTFSKFLNEYIESYVAKHKTVQKNELQLSTVFLAARIAGLRISVVKFKSGNCIDIGTKQGLENYISSIRTK